MPSIMTRGGAELYVKDWGTGRPLILIHGWPLSADSWDDVSVPLTMAGFRTIAYDRRGFGRSSQPWDGFDYDTLSDVTLTGFSMGGGEVARFLSRHGKSKVRSAALISSVVPFMLKNDTNPHGVPQEGFDQMLEGLVEDRAHFFNSFFKDFYGVGGLSRPVSDEWLAWTHSMAMQASLKATLDCVNAFATTDFRPDLKSFDLPTLIVHGTADKTVPIDATARPAAKAIRGSIRRNQPSIRACPHGGNNWQLHKARMKCLLTKKSMLSVRLVRAEAALIYPTYLQAIAHLAVRTLVK
jgi:non-heme chloroperoxidase